MSCIDSRYPGSYRARVRIPGGKRLTKSFDSRTEAEEWAFAQEEIINLVCDAVNRKTIESTERKRPPVPLESSSWPIPATSELAYITPTLCEALSHYLKTVTPDKKGAVQEAGVIRRWQRHPLAAFPLLAIRGHHLARYRDIRLESGISGATLRQEFAVISHLYKVARTDWGYETLENPVTMFRKPKVSKGRSRRCQISEELILIAYCDENGFGLLKNVIILAIETAMRRGEMMTLKRADVDFKRRIAYLRDTKNGDDREVPLTKRAVKAFKDMPKLSETLVVGRNGDVVSSDFHQACVNCGIVDLHLHDLRHEATTRLFEKGFNIMEVAAITGHKSLSMLKRYTHLKVASLLDRLG